MSPPPDRATLADLFDAGAGLVQRRLVAFVAVAALPGVPMTLLSYGLAPRLLDGFDGLPLFVLQLAWSFATLVTLGSAMQLGLVRAAGLALAGRPVDALDSYRLPARRYAALFLGLLPPAVPRMLLALIVTFLPLYVRDLLNAPGLLLIVLLTLAGLLAVSARLLFVAQIIVLEGGGPLAALRRSSALAERAFGRVWLTLTALEGFHRLLVEAPLLLARLLDNIVLAGWLVRADPFWYLLVTLLLTPARLAIYTALFYDLRERAEGPDLARRIAAG